MMEENTCKDREKEDSVGYAVKEARMAGQWHWR